MPSPQQPLTANDQVQNLILDSADFEDFLNELARFSAHQVAGTGDDALCGITLLRDRKAATIGWSSDSAREVDEIQYSLSQGPCLTAAKEEREVHVPDLHHENRWGPDYAKAVASHGLRSVLSVPFNLQGEAKAALNLYSDVPNKFDEKATAKARGFTREISQALRLAVRFSLHTDSAGEPPGHPGIADHHRHRRWHRDGPEPLQPEGRGHHPHRGLQQQQHQAAGHRPVPGGLRGWHGNPHPLPGAGPAGGPVRLTCWVVPWTPGRYACRG